MENAENVLLTELQERVPRPKSTAGDNTELREQWIKAIAENVENLEDKMNFMKEIRITAIEDDYQPQLNNNRIRQIFEEYKKRGNFTQLFNEKTKFCSFLR